MDSSDQKSVICFTCSSVHSSSSEHSVHCRGVHGFKQEDNLTTISQNGSLETDSRGAPNSRIKKERLSYYSCDVVFQAESELQSYITYNSSQDLSSEQCKESLDFKAKVENHMPTQTKEKPFKCEYCDRQYGHKESYKSHLRSKHGGPDKTTFPPNRFWNSDGSRKTAEKVKKEIPRCSLCNKTFSHKDALNKHTLIHTDPLRFGCDLCDRRFNSKYNLEQHKLIHSNETPFQCEFCDKGFRVKTVYNRHLKIHSTKKDHACHICDQTFRHKHNLKTHINRHNGFKPFTCPVCDKKFHTSSLLTNHQNTHEGFMRYQCDFCDKNFAKKTSLNVHMLSHTEKPRQFTCEICGRSFVQKNHLTQHMLVHSDQKPFECGFCDYKAICKKYMREHYMRVHTGNNIEPYQCVKCLKNFKSTLGCRKHKCKKQQPETTT